MNMKVVAVICSLWVVPAWADEPAKVSWKKTTIEGKFRSEGVAAADVNKDGKTDVLVGDFWYEAPLWTKHEIRKPGEYGDGLHGYSDCMACWADDINNDGWVDEIVVGFPGQAAAWYENPQAKDGHWPRHEIAASACNETPIYTNLFRTGPKVLVMGTQPKGEKDLGVMAYFTPVGDPTTKPWLMRAISEPSSPGHVIPGTSQFSHGLGVGDMNGDGRNDVICTAGWWEQPLRENTSTVNWTFHPAKLGEAAADMIAYDMTGDGKADVIASSAHKFGIWAYDQTASKDSSPEFTKRDLFPNLVSETHALIAADINGDGLKDLVTGKRFWSHGRSEPGSEKPSLLYWFEAQKSKTGAISFVPHAIDDQSGIGTQFVVLDFNGDGLLDVVTSNKKGVFLIEQTRDPK